MNRRSHLFCAAVAIALACAGCDKSPSQQPRTSEAPALRPVQPAANVQAAGKAVLRERLPDTAYAYLRVPSTWGVLGTTGGALDKVIGSAPYAEAVKGVREGLVAKLIPELPQEQDRFLARLLFQHATSPVEAITLPPTDPKTPLADVLVTLQVDFADVAAVNNFLTDAARLYSDVEVTEPLGASRPGKIALAGVPGQIELDAGQSRLYLLWSLSPKPATLADVRSRLVPNDKHSMRALEAGIDASGQGLFVWLNTPKLAELAARTIPNAGSQVATLASLKSVAAGIGTSGGINRLKLVTELPPNGFRAFMPVISDQPKPLAAGTPSMVTVLGMPSASDLGAIESAVAMVDPDSYRFWQQIKANLAAKLGFTVEELFATLGQDVTLIDDKAGTYWAVRLKDAQKFHAMLETGTQRLGLKHEQRTLGGHTYHHLIVPSPRPEHPGLDKVPGAQLAKRFLSVPAHLYWEEEGDYLMLAGLPQALIDRNYITERVPVDQWLRQQQRTDPAGALLLASGRNAGLPALIYEFQLQALSYAGDLVEHPVDMFALPTAREAGLPAEGAFSVKVTSNESQLAFEMAFESSPVEVLLAGNGYAGVAVAGLVAAIAIPQYNEYQVRAEVATGLTSTRELKEQIELFVRNQGHLPDEQELAALQLHLPSTEAFAVSVTPDDGGITVQFKRKGLGEEPTVTFAPHLENGRMRWSCSSPIAAKYLPPACRSRS